MLHKHHLQTRHGSHRYPPRPGIIVSSKEVYPPSVLSLFFFLPPPLRNCIFLEGSNKDRRCVSAVQLCMEDQGGHELKKAKIGQRSHHITSSCHLFRSTRRNISLAECTFYLFFLSSSTLFSPPLLICHHDQYSISLELLICLPNSFVNFFFVVLSIGVT